MGKLIVVKGPMFAGKTSKLIEFYNLYKDQNPFVAKPFNDDRYAGNMFLSTHDDVHVPCSPISHPRTLLNMAESEYSMRRVFIVDEVQFFKPNQFIAAVVDLVYRLDSVVVLGGMHSDQRGVPFKALHTLSYLADEVYDVKGKCQYHPDRPSDYTIRTQPDSEYENPVGGAEKYASVCTDCFDDYCIDREGFFLELTQQQKILPTNKCCGNKQPHRCSCESAASP